MTLQNVDKSVFDQIQKEFERQQDSIELIASENIVSKAVLEAQGSVLTNKYAEGYPGRRYYGGCEFVDNIENLAIERVKELFGCKYANVQPHSGTQANSAVYFSLLEPYDVILGPSMSSGGHLSHGSSVSFSGRYFKVVSYEVEEQSQTINYENIRELAIKHKPKLIIAGFSAYSRAYDFKKFKEIADEVGAYLFADIAHVAGLVAKGLHPSPVGYADVITTTTHKTLRGPRGAVILTNDEEIAKKINFNVFPGSQGGPLMHVIAAKAVAFKEALSEDFKTYMQNVLNNMKVFEKYFKEYGVSMVSGGTDNHLLCLDLTSFGITGLELEKALDSINITCNKNGIPFDKKKPFITSGIRIGTPYITSRGFDEQDCKEIATIITNTILELQKNKSLSDDYIKENKNKVLQMCSKYPIYKENIA